MGGVRVETGAVESICLEPFAVLRAADSKQPPQLLLILRIIALYHWKQKMRIVKRLIIRDMFSCGFEMYHVLI